MTVIEIQNSAFNIFAIFIVPSAAGGGSPGYGPFYPPPASCSPTSLPSAYRHIIPASPVHWRLWADYRKQARRPYRCRHPRTLLTCKQGWLPTNPPSVGFAPLSGCHLILDQNVIYQ